MTRKELIKKIHNYFSNKKEVTAVYLYGSYARNEQKDGSDIDLAVLFFDNIDKRFYLLLEYKHDLSEILQKKVELQELNNIRIDFAYRVLEEGIKIQANNEKFRINFEVKTMQGYFDLKPFFDEYYSVLRKQSLRGDFNA